MAATFQKAVRQRVFMKLGLMGPSGSGKTYSALRLARGLVGKDGRIALIDTENGSASLYADLTDFDVLDMAPPFHPDRFIDAIRDAVAAGYDAVVIDSFSHAWKFVLDMKDDLDARGGNKFANWKTPKALSTRLKDEILQSRVHVIACMRAKTEYVQEEKGGQYQKSGMGAVQEPDAEYEFSVVFDLAMDHTAVAGSANRGKDRTGLFARSGATMLTEKHGEQIRRWLDDAPEQAVKESTSSAPAQSDESVYAPAPSQPAAPKSEVAAFLSACGMGNDEMVAFRSACEAAGTKALVVLNVFRDPETEVLVVPRPIPMDGGEDDALSVDVDEFARDAVMNALSTWIAANQPA